MNHLYIILNFILLFILIFSKANDVSEGHVKSVHLPSTVNNFDYSIITDLVVFGDSYSETKTNYNNMKYSGENKSGGKDWPLHLIDLHDMYLWNFAYSGATITNSYLISSNPYPLQRQYEIFESKLTEGKELSRWNGETTLFAFWFGINDILTSTVSQEDTIKTGFEVLFDKVVEGLYNHNARNFLFFYLPPMEKAPYVIEGAYRDIPEFIEKFNTGLKLKMIEFYINHLDANVLLYEANTEFNYLIENHKLFNITSVKEVYVHHSHRNRMNYFWYDGLHPTDFVHKYMAIDIDKFLTSKSIQKFNFANENINVNVNVKANANLELSSTIKNYNYQKFYLTFITLLLLYYIFLL